MSFSDNFHLLIELNIFTDIVEFVSSSLLFSFLKVCFTLLERERERGKEGKRGRERKVFIVCFLNACSDQVWARSKLGAENSTWSPMWVQGLRNLDHHLLLCQAH